MSYTLTFYSVPDPPATIAHDPDSVATFIAEHGVYLGDMAFSAGGAASLLETLESLLGAPAYSLYSAPVFGVAPDPEDPIYGTISSDEVRRLLLALDDMLSHPDAPLKQGESAAQAAKRVTRNPEIFFDRVRELRQLLADSSANQGQLVTLYS
jgi:hypothetical protein